MMDASINDAVLTSLLLITDGDGESEIGVDH